ncbi:hypothetical protein ABE504_26985 [Paenibacillus oryzisoli]|uniref:hypothetical protein n=1 Tax=Paenibacillus oryzisoli TaxID=1850517 RepID=UPI003D27C284
MATDNKPSIHGGIIIATLIFFFPVSIVLMIIRSVKHRNLTHLRIMDKQFYGGLLLSLFLFMFLIMFVQSTSNYDRFISLIATGLIFLLPSLLNFRRASILKKELENRMEQYHFMIYEQEVSLISYMAEVVKQNVETVTNELTRMAALGRLPDAYVHLPTGQVILTNRQKPTASFSATNNLTVNLAADLLGLAATLETAQEQPKEPPPPPKTIECFGCGSKTQLQHGEQKECAYCGSLLHYT